MAYLAAMSTRIHAVFVDGNATWGEGGSLRRSLLGASGGPKTPGFVLENKDGTRIFPMSGRAVEVYDEEGELLVQTADGKVLVDRWPK